MQVAPHVAHRVAQQRGGDVDVAPLGDGLAGQPLGPREGVLGVVVAEVGVCDLHQLRVLTRRRLPAVEEDRPLAPGLPPSLGDDRLGRDRVVGQDHQDLGVPHAQRLGDRHGEPLRPVGEREHRRAMPPDIRLHFHCRPKTL